MVQLGRKYMFLYVILIVVLVIVTHMTSSILTKKQTTEMLISSILFIFFFGTLLGKLTNKPISESIAVYAFYFTLWYFITKAVSNLVMKDSNGVIITS